MHRRAWCAILYEYALREKIWAYVLPMTDTPGKIRHLRMYDEYLLKYTRAIQLAQPLPAFLDGMLVCVN